MRNWKTQLGIPAAVLVFVMAFYGCDSNPPSVPETIIYKGTDLGGNQYTLTIEKNNAKSVSAGQGDGYKMQTGNGTSSGTVTDVLDDTLTLKPSNGSEFNVTASGGVISSIIGNVTLSDGTVFIVRTFDEIHMRVGRWRNGGYFNEDGDNYAAVDIKLRDVFEGNLDELVSPDNKQSVTFRLSGTIDKTLKVHLRFFYIADDPSEKFGDNESNGQWLGGGPSSAKQFDSGEFSADIVVEIEKYDISNFPAGEVQLYLEHIVWSRYPEPHDDQNIGNDEDKIPDDIPNGTIMATIRNLKLEAVDIAIVHE